MWTVRLVHLWVFAAAAAYHDLRYRRVPNALVLAAAAAGCALSAAGGWGGCRAALCGMALGLALLFPAFLLGMVGGGDVKSLAVIGIVAGPGLLWVSFLRGAAAGGLAAAVLLAARRRRRGRKGAGDDGREGPGAGPAWTLPYAGILSLCAAVSACFAR